MNNIEDRLRQAFRADADTIRDVQSLTGYESAVRPGRARLNRVTRIVIPLAAAATVAAAAIAIAAVPKQQLRHPATGPAAAGMPRYIAILGNPDSHLPAWRYAVETKRVATGSVVARLAQLPGDRTPVAIAAFGAPGRFVVAARTSRVCATWFYQFRLTNAGHITDVRPLAVPKVAGAIDSFPQPLAASANAPIVAATAISCQQLAHRHLAYQLQVINVATKKVATWSLSGTAKNIGPAGLAVAANGRLVGLVTSDGDRPGISKFTGWTVPANSPSGSIARHWHKVTDYPWQAQTAVALSPNGDTMFTPGIFTRAHYREILDVEEYSTASGLGMPAPKVFTRLTDQTTFSLDHSGRYLLLGRGRTVKNGTAHYVVLNVASGHLTILPRNLIGTDAPRLAW
jgi:hypothetical protein